MKQREPSKPPNPQSPPPSPGVPPRNSGRVQFDERGQAIWEWAVKTGMFDRNASTQRIRALVEAPLSLSIDEGTPPADKPAARSTGGDLYERARTAAPAPKGVTPSAEGGGCDPYSRGPAKRPEDVSFNPYERVPPRKR